MEPFTVAASVISVASLAIQVADSVKKICKFLATIKDAPKTFKDLETDLLHLHQVLEEIQRLSERQKWHVALATPPPLLLAALQSCQRKVDKLESYTNESSRLLSQTGFSRTWNTLRMPHRDEKVAKLSKSVRKAIELLIASMSINAWSLQ